MSISIGAVGGASPVQAHKAAASSKASESTEIPGVPDGDGDGETGAKATSAKATSASAAAGAKAPAGTLSVHA